MKLTELSPKGTDPEVQGKLCHPLKSYLQLPLLSWSLAQRRCAIIGATVGWAGLQTETLHKQCSIVRGIGRCQVL